MNPTPAHISRTIKVIPLPGLHLDSLGSLLAALGLLSLSSRLWPSIRGGWRDGVFYLADGPATENELITFVAKIGEDHKWSIYQKVWDKHQKADTKGKTGRETALWRSQEAAEESLPLFQSHIAPTSRLTFNPLFGTGGNAGKRDFSIGWKKAAAAIKNPPRGWSRQSLNEDLVAFLTGKPCHSLGDYNSGCWFGAANKAYNSGTAKPFREGQLSPWAMTLACEAFALFQGSPSRRFGSAGRAKGAFPFVTTGAAPSAVDEAGQRLGEIWLPIWEQPMSLPEVLALFQRGRAEVNGRGATTPPAFAAAILQRGVDSGIREFRRFLLLRTTSKNTFESRLASVVSVVDQVGEATHIAIARMLGFRDSLPGDRMKGKRWIYVGLRGPLDEALVALAERNTPDSTRAAVDSMIIALRKADRNIRHREHKPSIRFQLLPGKWATEFFEKQLGTTISINPLREATDESCEARIGLALATLWSGKPLRELKKVKVASMLCYWLGTVQSGTYCSIPKSEPLRRVWDAGTVPSNLTAVLKRRLVEAEPSDEPPFESWYRVSLGDINAWLAGTLREEEVERWMMRFSLFEWNKESIVSIGRVLGHSAPPESSSGDLTLFALFKPLFQPSLLRALLSHELGRNAALEAGQERKIHAAKSGPLPGIAAQLARGDVAIAARLALNAYRVARIEPAKINLEGITCSDPQRLLGSLLIPTSHHGLTPDSDSKWKSRLSSLCLRWLLPNKQRDNQ